MNHAKVCIIILNWNGFNDTVECLESLKKITYPNYDVIVVDNASSGDDVRLLQGKFGDYINIIKNEKNYGFAKGNNIGIKYALEKGVAYVLLLNNDTVVAPDFLDELVQVAEANVGLGILCPMIYWYDQPDSVWFGGGFKVRLYRGTCTESRKEGSDQPLIRSEVATGAAMLIRRETIEKIGLLPEYHFFGVEDIDYSLGALKAGFGIAVATKSKVWHKGSRESTVARIGFHYRGWQIMRRKYLSMPAYIISTFSALTWAIMVSIIPFFRYLYHGDFRELRNFFRKIVSALKGIVEGAIWKSRGSSGGEGMAGEDTVPKQ
jgi:hypothetical protein